MCGEDGVVVENDFVTVGAQYSTLEQLASQPIFLGDTGIYIERERERERERDRIYIYIYIVCCGK